MADTLSKREKRTLDEFYPSVLSKDPSVRLECFSALEKYLSNVNNSNQCEDLTGFINGLFKWIEGSNYRISCNGLRLVELIVQRLDSSELGDYLDNVVSVTVDRLGDGKDQVREAASHLLLYLMRKLTPQRIWDLMQPLSFENKQFRIKEESQRLVIRTLNEYVPSISTSRLV